MNGGEKIYRTGWHLPHGHLHGGNGSSARPVSFCRFQWLNLLVTDISVYKISGFGWNIKMPGIMVPPKLAVISGRIRILQDTDRNLQLRFRQNSQKASDDTKLC